MNFLRALFWIVLTAVVVVFSMRNWVSVPIGLFGGLVAYVKLPVLLLAMLLAGWAPTYGWHRWQRWWLERRHADALREVLPPQPMSLLDPAPLPAVTPPGHV